MRSRPLASFLFLALASASAAPPAGDPAAAPLTRYQAMMARSPFAVASEKTPEPDAAAAGFAKDLVLTGAVRLREGGYITVASRDQSLRFALRTGETRDGLSIASIAWSAIAGKTRVTLKRGSEFGVIRFDEAAMQAAPGETPVAVAATPPPKPPRNRGRIASPPPDS